MLHVHHDGAALTTGLFSVEPMATTLMIKEIAETIFLKERFLKERIFSKSF